MKINRKLILLTLILLFITGLLTGCNLLERWKDTRQVERLARAATERYLTETYGQRGRIIDIEVGTSQAGVFGVVIQSKALLTVSLDGEQFKVYAETAEPSFCADNRQGMALAAELETYFQELYGLPEGYSHSVNLYFQQEGFFASHTSSIAREENFLPFAYEGQPLQEVLPLLDRIHFRCDFLDDSVSLSGVELREEDWGGSTDRIWLRLRCFRTYDPAAEVPVGIQLVKGQPILMAAGLEFSFRGASYGSLDQIAAGMTSYVLREAMEKQGEKFGYSQYTLTKMGNFWVSTREGFSAQACFELNAIAPDWLGRFDAASAEYSPYYSREELAEEKEQTQEKILPYLNGQCRQVGEALCLKEGAAEQISAWDAWGPNQDDKFPVFVMINPALVYNADGQMGAGILFHRDGEAPVHQLQIFSSYLDKERRWLNGLSILKYEFPRPVQLLVLVELYPQGTAIS